MSSEVKANKLSPATGTALQISDSGDTTTIPSGATLDIASGATLALVNDALSGDKIDGGTISDFASTGIDDNGVSTALTIDSSNRVGVGVAPAWDFHVETSVNSNYVAEIENTSTTAPSVLQLRFGGSAPDEQLRIRKFSFKSDPNAEQKIGVVAQEVEQVSPHLVYEDDGIKGVKYSILYMKAVKALQEAMERIEVLEGRVNDIEVS